MCVAIVQQPHARISRAALAKGWHRNSDGAGMAYVVDGKVVIDKGYMTYEKFLAAYERAVERYGDKSPFLIHMRIQTSGDTDKHNTHPFKVRGGAMIHNGILFTPTGKHAQGKKKPSDTKVLANTLHNILVKEDIILAKPEIEKVIGGYNKLAFLYDDGEFVIVNEEAGDWDMGIWYSNDSCEIKYPMPSKSGATTPSSK